jgi:hypothetical protein
VESLARISAIEKSDSLQQPGFWQRNVSIGPSPKSAPES